MQCFVAPECTRRKRLFHGHSKVQGATDARQGFLALRLDLGVGGFAHPALLFGIAPRLWRHATRIIAADSGNSCAKARW